MAEKTANLEWLILIGTLNFTDFQVIVNKLEITAEDKNELENLLKIATSQIPRYFNLVNSAKEKWQIKDINECIFGMVFEKYIHDSGQYLSNKGIDDNQPNTIESTMEAYDVGIEVFDDNVAEVKRLIQENN